MFLGLGIRRVIFLVTDNDTRRTKLDPTDSELVLSIVGIVINIGRF